MDLLGQAKPGDKVRFTQVSIEEAHTVLRKYEEEIKKIKEILQ